MIPFSSKKKSCLPLFILFFLFVLSPAFFTGCGQKVNSPDLETLKVLRAEMEEVARLDKKLQKETLSRKELKQLAPGQNLRLEDPAPIKEIIDYRYLDLAGDFFSHLESSQINNMGNGTRSEVKLFNTQNMLRYETMAIFMKKLYKMNDSQTEFYYDRIRNLSPEGRIQMNYMMNTADLAYYKNIPELTGRTTDDDASIFFTVRIHLGYRLGEKKTQTILNQNKNAMADSIRNYFSSRHSNELESENEPLIKAQLRVLLNRQVLKYDKTGDLDGIEDVTIVGLQTYSL